jgi:hypothetical protein
MDDLVVFLSASLDDDERVALAATPPPWVVRGLGRHDGAAVLHDDGRRGTVGLPLGPAFMSAHGGCATADAAHVARWDPARVLAEVAAKRKILRRYQQYADRVAARAGERLTDELVGLMETAEALRRCVRDLARPLAGRPGWRPEWATEVTA